MSRKAPYVKELEKNIETNVGLKEEIISNVNVTEIYRLLGKGKEDSMVPSKRIKITPAWGDSTARNSQDFLVSGKSQKMRTGTSFEIDSLDFQIKSDYLTHKNLDS